MRKLLRIFEVTTLFMSILSCFVFAQEQITITTYYPSPYGSYFDLSVQDSLQVGPYPMANVQGRVHTGGTTAEFSFARRDLAAAPGNVAGDRFVWYNPNGTARLWTPVTGDLLIIDSNANINILTPSQVTVDPLNGVGGYTAQPRFRDNNDTP